AWTARTIHAGSTRLRSYRAVSHRSAKSNRHRGRLSFRLHRRKVQLLQFWQTRAELASFWQEPIEIAGRTYTHSAFQRATEISDDDFCELCQHVQLWIARENASRPQQLRISKPEVVGLRSSENYED